MQNNQDSFFRLMTLVRQIEPELAFTMLEIGALPLKNNAEPFYHLCEFFPQSRIIGFEVDAPLCAQMNQETPPQFEYYATALGKTDGEAPFYVTEKPMCCSLYRPNEALLSKYNALEACALKQEIRVQTASLDRFVAEHQINDIDFIKIDIQGAELDVFEGGSGALKNVVCIVSEVEFIPVYQNQPLFGDVCAYLDKQDLMFHKFLGVSGRALKPMVIQNNPNIATQHMWADAVFIRHIAKLDQLEPRKLLKLAVYGYMYNSPDLSFHCFEQYDRRLGTNTAELFVRAMQGGS